MGAGKACGDDRALMAVPEPGIAGAICGRALYDGRIDPKSAMTLVMGDAVKGAAC